MPPDWMYVPFTLNVTVPIATSEAIVKEAMRWLGVGPLATYGAVQWGPRRPYNRRLAAVHFSSAFCEGPSAARSEEILTFLRRRRTKLKVFPNAGQTYWIASLDRHASGLIGAAAVHLVCPDKKEIELPALSFDDDELGGATATPGAVVDLTTVGDAVVSVAGQNEEAAYLKQELGR